MKSVSVLITIPATDRKIEAAANDDVVQFQRHEFMDAKLPGQLHAFLTLSPSERKRFAFHLRLAGRTVHEAFGLPPRMHSLGAAANGLDPETAKAQFREAARGHGLVIKDLIADGMAHRCDAGENRHGKNDGADQLDLSGPTGWFYNHRAQAGRR